MTPPFASFARASRCQRRRVLSAARAALERESRDGMRSLTTVLVPKSSSAGARLVRRPVSAAAEPGRNPRQNTQNIVAQTELRIEPSDTCRNAG